MRKKVKKFKGFEASHNYLSNDDVNDLFIEIIDDGFDIKFFDTASHGSYFFEFRKNLEESILDPIDVGSAYGITNISEITNQMNFLKTIEEIKQRLESIGYKIGFEFEFNFGLGPMLYFVCHMQYISDVDTTLDSQNRRQFW